MASPSLSTAFERTSILSSICEMARFPSCIPRSSKKLFNLTIFLRTSKYTQSPREHSLQQKALAVGFNPLHVILNKVPGSVSPCLRTVTKPDKGKGDVAGFDALDKVDSKGNVLFVIFDVADGALDQRLLLFVLFVIFDVADGALDQRL